jgi:hypothetical protein
LDVLVLLTIATISVIALLFWPDYAVSTITVSIAAMLLLVILR